ncbi:MGMT family protein (plasmid) [Rhodococcus sp. ZPP]|uniref:MGMT family protein n=1 Tax=Rhodococcus sp. ZPP TaxID=2749906 RepID=UPI001AD852B7|nr:MGMT family protein [Rhodococcus sp. ZPP]QTJ70782.1 MGMT family protein [Rhodococcus sp. ZPP]
MNLVENMHNAVASIPVGRVATYGDIGVSIGVGARQVGRMMTLLDSSVPWWRVVHADGTPPSCHGGAAPRLLHAERTPMHGRRVDMTVARYRPEPTT